MDSTVTAQATIRKLCLSVSIASFMTDASYARSQLSLMRGSSLSITLLRGLQCSSQGKGRVNGEDNYLSNSA